MALLSLRRGPGAFLPLLQELHVATGGALRFAQPSFARRHIATSSAASDALANDAISGPTPTNLPDAASTAAHSTVSTTDDFLAPRIVESKQEALALLRAQPIHYVVASLVGKTMVLHTRDLFTLPRIKEVQVGDVLELDRIHEVGSRDYTLRAQDPMSTRMIGAVGLAYRSVPVPPGPSDMKITSSAPLVESQSWAARLRPSGLAHVGAILGKDTVRVRCTVMEHTKGPMEFIHKKKRRKGYEKTIRHKQSYTRVRVESIRIGDEGGN